MHPNSRNLNHLQAVEFIKYCTFSIVEVVVNFWTFILERLACILKLINVVMTFSQNV